MDDGAAADAHSGGSGLLVPVTRPRPARTALDFFTVTLVTEGTCFRPSFSSALRAFFSLRFCLPPAAPPAPTASSSSSSSSAPPAPAPAGRDGRAERGWWAHGATGQAGARRVIAQGISSSTRNVAQRTCTVKDRDVFLCGGRRELRHLVLPGHGGACLRVCTVRCLRGPPLFFFFFFFFFFLLLFFFSFCARSGAAKSCRRLP